MGTNRAWLVAAMVASMVAVSVAVTIIQMIPGTTVIDVGALVVTGFFAGLFFGIHVMQPRRTGPT